ncbi:hypothetical protein PGT21_021828 [Puccinia graminis f. sp. tritici]|uniref:Uncharacterized protein n=1 Tax=Puccinia graminis f. sp. tritici TaxID=56615 RepID=A0A5B0NEV2_PUCGR|nr:hypothetical protein PGT21_021828 [Puccinia graminis f. sp. tritici]
MEVVSCSGSPGRDPSSPRAFTNSVESEYILSNKGSWIAKQVTGPVAQSVSVTMDCSTTTILATQESVLQ